MKRAIRVLLALAVALTALSAGGCVHEHTPGPAATCTEPQVCTECGEELAPAKGHTPGDEATCLAPQICTVCNAILAPAKGHVPGPEATCTADQVCTVCGEVLVKAPGHVLTVTPEGQVCSVCGKLVAGVNQQYTPGGGGGNVGTATYESLPETANEGHYHADITPYKVNAVVIAGDYGYEQVYASASGSSAYAQTLNEFAAKYPALNVTSLIVPKCAVFHSVDGYKSSFDAARDFINNTYAQMDARIKKADAFGVMSEHIGEYLFYRSDHHWTGLGAYYASVAYCNANGITPYALDTYDTVVKPGFYGTLYTAYSNKDANLIRNPDVTIGHYPHIGYAMTIWNGGGWYGGTAINANTNTYAGMYIGGDNALTVIDTDNKNGRRLILFKESYGNAFSPYMIDYYERVVIVDIRKSSPSVAALIEQYEITDALIINNIQAVTGNYNSMRGKVLS